MRRREPLCQPPLKLEKVLQAFLNPWVRQHCNATTNRFHSWRAFPTWQLLEANLLASPCLDAGSPNEVIVVKGCPAAANGLKLAFEWARREWIACVHQDVFLPRGWDQLVTDQLKEAERRFGPIGVAGVYGVGGRSFPTTRHGRSAPNGLVG